MDLPQPPDDQDQKNIIDKLANFVARNGPEFEHMTKQKQKDNPKFSFLFGGEHYNYYQYKVTTEQAIINQHKQKAAAMMQQAMSTQPPSLQQAPWQQVQPATVQVQAAVQPSQQEQQLQQQIAVLEQQLAQEKENMEKQVRESEANLQAHHNALMQVREHQIEAALMTAREDELQRLSQECDIPPSELDHMAQPILEACTKENISVGKNWIFSHSITPQHGDLIALYLLKRVSAQGVTFQNKLHIMYLMNDVLHHCIRKNMEDLLSSMRKVVLPMCGLTFSGVDEDKLAKMHKLVNLWEQHKYFSPDMISYMRDPKLALAKYKEQQSLEFPDAVEQVSASVNNRFAQLQGQHQEFVNHLRSQVTVLETSLGSQQSQLQTLQAQHQAQAAAVAVTAQAGIPPPQQVLSAPGGPPAGFEVPIYNQTPPTSTFQPTTSFQPPVQQPPQQQTFDYSHGNNATPVVQDYNHGQAPPTSGPPSLTGGPPPSIDLSTIDLSKPPPGFPMPGAGSGAAPGGPISDESLMPTVPYYDLPAGLMAPLVKTEAKLPTPLLEVKVDRPMPGRRLAGPPPSLEELLPSASYFDLPPGLLAPEIKSETKPTPLLEVKVERPVPTGPPPSLEDLLPSAPYFDLPGGLMAPLIKLEDSEYKPLDPKDIRLPPPVPPSERLLAAVEAFYSQPTHERPRDSEGWEKLGLFEYYKAKEKAKKIKEDQKASGERPESRSPSPVNVLTSPAGSPVRANERSRSRSPPRRRYRSKSRSPSPEQQKRQSRSRSRSRSSSGSRSSSSSRSRSRSGSRSSSSTPPKYKRRSRSRSRSATPPSFLNMPGASMETRLGMENKGHQLLTKMGWGGAGLGKAEQGRVEPVESADVRDQVDKFKGVGNNMKDPFEQFRKNKAQGFIQRMRARDT